MGRWMGVGLEKLLFSCFGKFVFPSWNRVFPRKEMPQDRVVEFFSIAWKGECYVPAYSCPIRIAVGSRELKGVAGKAARGLRTSIRSPRVLYLWVYALLIADADGGGLALLPEAVNRRDHVVIRRATLHTWEDEVGVGRDAHQVARVGDVLARAFGEGIDGIVEGRLGITWFTIVVPEDHMTVFVGILEEELDGSGSLRLA